MTRLAEIGSAAIGLTYSPSAVADGGTLVLRSSNIQNEQLVFHDNVFVEMDVPASSRVQPGDILVCARNGSRPLIGKSVLLDHRVEGMAFGAFMALFRSPFNNYVIHQFRSHAMRQQIEMHLGATINQITNSSLLSFEIPFPMSENEREVIAEALNDADAAIESLDTLITKKRDVRQAVMQQLLTGRTRLPGFTADWQELKVADAIVESFSGPSPTCLQRNIQGDEWGVFKTTCSTLEQGWDYTKHKVLPRIFWGMTRSLIEVGDTVITKAGPRHRVGVAAYVDKTLGRLIVSGKMIGLRPNVATVCPPFLALALKNPITQDFLNQRTTGMAESQVNFENIALLEAPLYLPSLKEQEAIAETLSVIDGELKALTEQVSKLRMVKVGIMQDLLSGKVRLV